VFSRVFAATNLTERWDDIPSEVLFHLRQEEAMVLNIFPGPKDQPSSSKGKKLRPTFDFVVAERPKYIPNSGPPLAPISIMPAHDKDGIILDKIQPSGQALYVVGYEDKPHLRIAVKPQNILNWVSARTFFDYDYEQSQIQERLREEIELPIILAKEERRRRKEEKKVERESRGIVDGRKRKRTLDLELPRKMGRTRINKAVLLPMAPPSGPGGRNQPPQEEVVFTSPRSQHSQQPSLSTPVRGLAERITADSDTEDEDSLATELALERQLNFTTPRSHLNQEYSRSTTSSPEPLKQHPARPRSASMVASSRNKARQFSITSPFKLSNANPQRREQHDYPPVLPGTEQVAYTASREARALWEDLEANNKKAIPSINQGQPNFTKKPSPFKPAKKPYRSVHPPRAGPTREPKDRLDEDQDEDEEVEPEADEDEEEEVDDQLYEVKAITDCKIEEDDDGRRRKYYLVHWKGSWDDTWEPAGNVGPEAIRRYRRKLQELGLDGANSSDNNHLSDPSGHTRHMNSVLPRITRNDRDVAIAEGTVNYGDESDEDSLFVSDRPPNSGEQAGDRMEKQDWRPSRGEVIDQDSDDSSELQWQEFGVSV
jgi:hypothetical protein